MCLQAMDASSSETAEQGKALCVEGKLRDAEGCHQAPPARWTYFCVGCSTGALVKHLRSGGPGLKATQVYPAGFGKNIQKAQRKLKDDSKSLY